MGETPIPAEYGKELAYDLRQIYARIVGEHLQDIAEARKSDNFYVYFKNLEDLHTIVKHKFKKPEDETQYQNLLSSLVTLANKYPHVWLGSSKEPKAFAEIEKALRAIEMCLYEKMSDAKMFGSGGEYRGL